jgi:hypothetical protein
LFFFFESVGSAEPEIAVTAVHIGEGCGTEQIHIAFLIEDDAGLDRGILGKLIEFFIQMSKKAFDGFHFDFSFSFRFVIGLAARFFLYNRRILQHLSQYRHTKRSF